MRRVRAALTIVALALAVDQRAQVAGQQVLWREDFAEGAWRAAPAAGVQLSAAVERDATRPALRLDFDFQGRGGWAAVRRNASLTLPENWELRFRVRGNARPNHFEIKFVDPSGENVWWSVKRDFAFPADPTLIRIKKRHVSFAWGPAGGGDLKQVAALELAITAGDGGRGTVRLSDFELRSLPPERPYSGTPRAVATFEAPGGEAQLALDGRRDTAWRPSAPREVPADLTVDFGQARIFGGVTLFWEPGRSPRRLALDVLEAGEDWREARRVDRGGSSRTDIMLPDAEATAVRIRVLDAPGGAGLSEMVVRPLEFGASPNAFFEAIAAESPRGTYPRGFSGEQAFWTIAGVDGDPEESLVSEDGTVEIGDTRRTTRDTRNPSLEPFLWIDGRLWGWAERTASPALVDGDLPVPLLTWEQGGLRVNMTVVAAGEPGRSSLVVRYRIENVDAARHTGRFFLAVRPFQVNPPSQFLNRSGGVAPIQWVVCTPPGVLMLPGPTIYPAPRPSACGAAAFDEGTITDWLARGEVPPAPRIDDAAEYASGALAWDFALDTGEHTSVVIAAPFHESPLTSWPGLNDLPQASRTVADALFEELLEGERARWRERLDRVRLDLPKEASGLDRVIRSNLAWILVNRDGPAIQPGSRAYERSWIRDGALTSTALLRLGHADEARAFAEWFATFQYPDGRIPCCVDHRGADPVPEHDSHGEFIHLVAEVTRFTQDRAFASRMFPHVERAAAAIDALRAQRRTAEYRTGAKSIFFGLLPESISHEGYSAKPMHSYWDSGFGWRGLADARWLAEWLGRSDLAAKYAASFAEMSRDFQASLSAVRAAHTIDYVPGAAELADFDSTSTTVMLDPVGLDALLGRDAFVATFERYDREVRERVEGRREWDAYTPYEVRHIGTYVRLGWRGRAQRLLQAFLADRRPPGWNQWPEVVTREMRTPRFLGDLPHGWVASDFIRSALDIFAYERYEDGALILGAGVPAEWIGDGGKVAVRDLRSPWGSISYELGSIAGVMTMRVDPIERWPAGGVKAALPLPPGASTVTVDGRDAAIDATGMVSLPRLPALVEVRRGK